MEDLKALSAFFEATRNDGRISITHIGVYAALVQYWLENQRPKPIVAFCHQVLSVAKVSAQTYRKCVRDLSDYGYLRYIPSKKRNCASEIYLSTFDSEAL